MKFIARNFDASTLMILATWRSESHYLIANISLGGPLQQATVCINRLMFKAVLSVLCPDQVQGQLAGLETLGVGHSTRPAALVSAPSAHPGQLRLGRSCSDEMEVGAPRTLSTPCLSKPCFTAAPPPEILQRHDKRLWGRRCPVLCTTRLCCLLSLTMPHASPLSRCIAIHDTS